MTKAAPKLAPATRELVLDAAERVVVMQGVARMTLDEVAREAALTKGGLLYHFPSKEALTEAMVDRFVRRFDEAVLDCSAADENPLNRSIRSYVRATAGQSTFTGDTFDRVNAAITAALANYPERLEPVRQQSERNQRLIVSDAEDPMLATIIRFAIDGLWLGENFGLMRIDDAAREAICQRLIDWTEHRNLPGSGTGA